MQPEPALERMLLKPMSAFSRGIRQVSSISEKRGAGKLSCTVFYPFHAFHLIYINRTSLTSQVSAKEVGTLSITSGGQNVIDLLCEALVEAFSSCRCTRQKSPDTAIMLGQTFFKQDTRNERRQHPPGYSIPPNPPSINQLLEKILCLASSQKMISHRLADPAFLKPARPATAVKPQSSLVVQVLLPQPAAMVRAHGYGLHLDWSLPFCPAGFDRSFGRMPLVAACPSASYLF
jgi:hypothetical protein